MNLNLLQECFQRAWCGVDKKKCLIVFVTLCLCGVFATFSRVMSLTAGKWVALSLSFIPVFIIGGVLFALGLLLIKAYQSFQDVENISYQKIVLDSGKTILSVSYLTLPLLALCVANWLIFGLFFLLKAVPGVGDFFSVVFSIAPFVLVFLSLVLVFANVVLLFFLTPSLAKDQEISLHNLQKNAEKIIENPLISLVNFTIGAAPMLIMLLFLILTTVLLQHNYLTTTHPILIGFKWFLLMIPFNVMLTPTVIFFFNFASESHHLMNEESELSSR